MLYILVYVGAIEVLFVYVIQLVDTIQSNFSLKRSKDGSTSNTNQKQTRLTLSVLLAIPLLALYLVYLASYDIVSPIVSTNDSTTYTSVSNGTTLQELASYLFGDYAYVLVMSVHAIILAVIGPVKLALAKSTTH